MESGDARRQFEHLYTETYQKVLAYCLRRARTPADADDAVAATYLVAWRRLDDFVATEHPLAWLYRVAYRTLANQYRSRRRATALFDRLRAVPYRPLPGPDQQVEQSGEIAAAFAALSTLPAPDQELIRLAAFENLTYAEIAVVTGSSESAVRSKLFRARARLRAATERHQPPGPERTP